MTIRKGKPAGFVMIARRPVNPFRHDNGRSKTSVVNTVRIFIEINEGHCRTRYDEVREFPVNVIGPIASIAMITVEPGAVYRKCSTCCIRIGAHSLVLGET